MYPRKEGTDTSRAAPELTPLHPFGIEVRNVDLSRALDQATFEQVEGAFNRAGVAVFRDQSLSPDVQIAFSKRFGVLETHVRQEYALPGYPHVHLVSNIKDGARNIGSAYAGDNWHTDLCFMRKPARLSILHAREVPHDDEGRALGGTLFVNVADAFDRLDAGAKNRVARLRGIHQYHRAQEFKRRQREKDHPRAPLSEEQKAQTPDVSHPVVRTHPFTARKCLYVNPTYTFGIVGWPEDEARMLLEGLFAHCLEPENIYRHEWRVGDVLMWDNCSTWHKAVGDYAAPQRRLMHRTAVMGDEPF